MSNSQKLSWLKQILAVKTAFTLLAWGLPALLAPMSLFRLLGAPTPDDPLFVRLFGAVVTAVGLAYWYAYRDPIRNVSMVKVGILDNGLVTLTILVFTVFYGLTSVFIWASGLLTFAFFVSFILLIPRPEAASPRHSAAGPRSALPLTSSDAASAAGGTRTCQPSQRS